MSAPNVPMLVLRALLTKRGWHAFSHVVRVDSFESNEYRRLYQHVERLHGVTESDITIAGLRADVAIQYSDVSLAEELGLVLDRLAATEELAQDLMESLVRRFLERSVSNEIAQYVIDHGDKSEFSIDHVTDLIARAVEVGDRVGQVVTDLLASPLSGASDNRRAAHGLGCSRQLDLGLRGGVGPGELCIYLGGPSSGKTSLLCRTGSAHAANGGRVLHVTLEINTRKVVERYDQCWTGRSSDDLQSEEGQQAVRTARGIVRESGGHVWVVDWSYLTVSAGDIGAKVRQMRGTECDCGCGKPMSVDMVIIDYLELMSPRKLPGKEMRQAYAAVGKEMRSLACNLDIPIMTAWQANRAGSDVDLLSKKDISESWDTVKTADIILGINQSLAESGNKRMRLNIIKQRESTDRGVFELYCDLDRMVIRDVTHADTRDLVNAVLHGSGGDDVEQA